MARQVGYLAPLAVVVMLSLGIALVGPMLLGETADEAVRREQQVWAELGAERIGESLQGIADRLAHGAKLAGGDLVKVKERPTEVSTVLERLVWRQDRERGIALFVHDAHGQVLGVGPGPSDAARQAMMGHVHHDPQQSFDAATVAVCTKCYDHMGMITVEAPLPDGLFLAANVPLSNLADHHLPEIGHRSSSRIFLQDRRGVINHEVGVGPVDDIDLDHEVVVARAPIRIDGIAWRVVVFSEQVALAPAVQARSRVLFAASAVILLLALLAGVLIYRDVRRRDQLRLAQDRALAHRDKLATVGMMAAGVNHEIRNVLHSSLMLLDLAAEDAEGTVQADIEEAHRVLGSLSTLTNDLLRFVRADRPELETFDLEEVATGAMNLVKPQLKRYRIVYHRPKASLIVHGSGVAMTQILVNLMLNAGQAMSAAQRGTQLMLSIEGHAETARVVVSDDGPGIPPTMLPNLFEAFSTSKEPGAGTGLGLWLTKRLVGQMGGSIHAHNRDSGGARFVIELCVAQAPKDGAWGGFLDGHPLEAGNKGRVAVGVRNRD